jgi:hypothetical protein
LEVLRSSWHLGQAEVILWAVKLMEEDGKPQNFDLAVCLQKQKNKLDVDCFVTVKLYELIWWHRSQEKVQVTADRKGKRIVASGLEWAGRIIPDCDVSYILHNITCRAEQVCEKPSIGRIWL